MKFTFGICTYKGNEARINTIIDSIEKQNIPTYEIIVVGEFNDERKFTKKISFDENKKPNWLTRKKNIIAENANYDNIVFLHDYVKFNNGWYNGQLKAGDDFFVRVDKILDINGNRAGDWLLCMWEDFTILEIIGNSLCCLLPYELKNLSKHMYISGSYFIAKKKVVMEFLFDEARSWGESEDVEWCKRVRTKYNFDINTNSTVQFMKEKQNPFKIAEGEMFEKLKFLNDYYSSYSIKK